MIWDSANCYFHNFLMDPCSLLVSKLSHRPRPSLPLPTPLPLSLPDVGVSPNRAKGTRPRGRLDCPENCCRRDEQCSRFSTRQLRDPSRLYISLHSLHQLQFTGGFDPSNGDDAALLSDINSRAQGLRQAVDKDEKHTLSPEAIVRYVYIYMGLI